MPNKNFPRISQGELPGYKAPKSKNLNETEVNERFETVGRDTNGRIIEQKNMFSLAKGNDEKNNNTLPVDTIIPDSDSEEDLWEDYSQEEDGWFSGEPDLPDPELLRLSLRRSAQNPNELPPNTRDLINEQSDFFEKFSRVERIQDYEFLLGPCYIISTNNNEYVIPSLVRQEGHLKWKYRIFRTSSSDLQFKCHNALRSGLMDSFKKGEETNPKHHYAQSGKIFTDLHLILEDIYKNNSIYYENRYLTYSFLPKDSINGNGGRYEAEDEMRETYFEPKNKLLATEMERRIREEDYIFDLDDITNPHASVNLSIPYLVHLLNDGNFLNFCDEFLGKGNVEKIKRLLDLYKKIKETDEIYQTKISEEKKEEIRELIEETKKIRKTLRINATVANTIRQQNYTLPFEPNFETDKPIRTYSKFGIEIEDYLVETPEGDQLVFAMAHDQEGRVYVDNIYSFPPRMTSYGTYENIANFGKIVYKPTDHEDQSELIDEKFRHQIEGTSNYDISEFHALIPLVNRYCYRLFNQGKYVFALRDLH